MIGTLLKANLLVKRFKEHPQPALTFRPVDLEGCGLLVVVEASLGNVTRQGAVGDDAFARICSQSAYYVLLADAKLLRGEEGRFAVLDARSHRLSRACRSTFAAELYSTEEAFDVGIYCRGALAELQDKPVSDRFVDAVLEMIPLAVVTDSKDCYDKGSSDTPSRRAFASVSPGSDRSWPENTMLKRTNTENMFVDCGTKEMSSEHVGMCITFWMLADGATSSTQTM